LPEVLNSARHGLQKNFDIVCRCRILQVEQSEQVSIRRYQQHDYAFAKPTKGAQPGAVGEFTRYGDLPLVRSAIPGRSIRHRYFAQCHLQLLVEVHDKTENVHEKKPEKFIPGDRRSHANTSIINSSAMIHCHSDSLEISEKKKVC